MSFLHIWLKWSDNLKVSDLSQFSLILDGRKLRLEEGTWLAGGDTASLYKARSLLDISVSTQAFLTANEYYHMASNIWNFILLPVPGWKAQLKLMFGYLATPLPSDKEGWVPKNWCFRTVVLEKTLESPLDSKEIKPIKCKGNQPWILYWKDWCWSWSSNTLATWCKGLTHWKRPWCWGRLRAGKGW